jgi:hypothetical protein
VPGRLVLVTRAYESGNLSTDDIVVLARLQTRPSVPRRELGE